MANVSIIIPAYKTQDYIEECLNSILSQVSRDSIDYEIFVGIDKCEETRDIVVGKFSHLHNLWIVDFNENVGPYVVKNTLSLYAKGDWLLFFDSDDVMLPNAMTNIFLGNTNEESIRFKYTHLIDSGNVKEPPMYSCSEGNFCVKKDSFYRSGGFLPWRCAADTEFRARFRRRYDLAEHITDKPIFKYRIRDKSLTTDKNTGFGSNIRQEYIKVNNIFSLYGVKSIHYVTTRKYTIIKGIDKNK